MTTSVDIQRRFPGLANGWARFDGPAGTQMVDSAIRAMTEFASSGINANTGGYFSAANECDALLERTRGVLATLFGADPEGICLGANMTTMTMALTRAIARTLKRF
jgi:selenocysteine lyase/cysteine desulfurase